MLLEVLDLLAQLLQLGLAAKFVEALFDLEGERAHLAREAAELPHHQRQVPGPDDDDRHQDQKNHFREADARHHGVGAPSTVAGKPALVVRRSVRFADLLTTRALDAFEFRIAPSW